MNISNQEKELELRKERPNHPGYSYPIQFRPIRMTDTRLLGPVFRKESKSIRTYLGSYQHADKWNVGDVQKFVSALVDPKTFPSLHYLFTIGNQVVGIGSLEPYGSDPRNTQIVLAVFGGHQGKGIGKAIANTLHYLAFQVWGFDRLYWINDATNFASSKLAQNLGLSLEETYEDDFKYGERGSGLWYRWTSIRPENVGEGILQGEDINYWSTPTALSTLEQVIRSKK